MPQADDTTTTVEETVDTSTNEEALDTGSDLEEDSTSFDDVEDTEETEDLKDEDTDTEPLDTEEDSEDDEEQSKETEDEESDEPEESSDEETKEEDTTSEEDIKKHNQEMAARRIAEKQAKEAAKQEQQQKYLDDAEDQKDLALRQLQVDAYNNRIERNRDKLDTGIERAVASIDLFSKGTPEVKEELARRLDAFEAQYVQYDTNGDPVSVNADVYEYLQKEADSIRRIQESGARQQVKNKEKAKARTETIPSKTPKEPKVDPDLAAFDEEVEKWSQSLKGLKNNGC